MIREEYGSFGEIKAVEDTALRWSLPSTDEMRRLDQATISSGTTGGELMTRAGTVVAREILRDFSAARRCVVVCGSGNNGGDGIVVARVLREAGMTVTCVLTSAERYSEDLLNQIPLVGEARILGPIPSEISGVNARCSEISEAGFVALLSSTDIVVDALLGTGQRAAPRGAVATVVKLVNQAREAGSSVKILAVDTPTGVDADTGALFEPHFACDRTYAIECVKRGLAQFPARQACGVITVLSIGIEPKEPVEFVGIEGRELPKFPARSAFAHKGDMGRILVVGGSSAMPGAALLAAVGALRSGAGLVSRLVKRAWAHTLLLPECMNEMLPGDEDCFMRADAGAALAVAASFDTIILGPGLGLANETEGFVASVLDGLRVLGKRVVIDADAINLVARGGVALRGLNAIITPHPGEAGRLLGKPTPTIQADRFSAARELWHLHKVVVVLKGAGTLVYENDRGGVVLRGTPYLATAGSGDVLAGITAACFSRLPAAYEAASLGAWIHARAGMLAAERNGGPIIAGDIALAVAPIIGAIES